MEAKQSSNRSSGLGYNGVRMRKCGKWVAEIRIRKKRSRVWIGTYRTAIAAARAHDMALFHLMGRSDKLNFPEYFVGMRVLVDELPAEEIRRLAIAVGAEVDAAELGVNGDTLNNEAMRTESDSRAAVSARVVSSLPDLNEVPAAEESDGGESSMNDTSITNTISVAESSQALLGTKN